jgi:hypothetical protein
MSELERYIENEQREQRQIDFVESEILRCLVPIKITSDLIDPFLKKWMAVLYYERNRTPIHHQFQNFCDIMESMNYDVVGKDSAIRYFVYINKGVIPQVEFTNYAVRITV